MAPLFPELRPVVAALSLVASSFPSGHASQAFAVATAIAENYPVWWVQTLCYGGAGLVGYARIEQNDHYASDVVAGSLLGWAVARAVVHRHNGPPNPENLNWSHCADGDGARLVFSSRFDRRRPRLQQLALHALVRPITLNPIPWNLTPPYISGAVAQTHLLVTAGFAEIAAGPDRHGPRRPLGR